jgi:methionine-rich copper-binding protein CopC
VIAFSRRSGRLTVAVLAAIFLIFTAAGAASANQLDGSSPSSGAKLTKSPSQVSLSFSQPVLFGQATVTVVGPTGDVTSGSPQIQGQQVVQALKGNLKKGSYQVSWKVMTFDRKVRDDSGGFSFTIAPRKPKPKVTETPTPTPTSTRAAKRTHALSPRPLSTQTRASASPTDTAVPAPAIQGVSYTGADRLPSPPVVWAVLILLGIVGYAINRVAGRRDR